MNKEQRELRHTLIHELEERWLDTATKSDADAITVKLLHTLDAESLRVAAYGFVHHTVYGRIRDRDNQLLRDAAREEQDARDRARTHCPDDNLGANDHAPDPESEPRPQLTYNEYLTLGELRLHQFKLNGQREPISTLCATREQLIAYATQLERSSANIARNAQRIRMLASALERTGAETLQELLTEEVNVA